MKPHEIFMMMMINSRAPISRARQGGKGGEEEGEVKGEYAEIKEIRWGILTTRKWCNSVSNMLHHV